MSSARELSTGVTYHSCWEDETFYNCLGYLQSERKKLQKLLKGCYCTYLDFPPAEA